MNIIIIIIIILLFYRLRKKFLDLRIWTKDCSPTQ